MAADTPPDREGQIRFVDPLRGLDLWTRPMVRFGEHDREYALLTPTEPTLDVLREAGQDALESVDPDEIAALRPRIDAALAQFGVQVVGSVETSLLLSGDLSEDAFARAELITIEHGDDEEEEEDDLLVLARLDSDGGALLLVASPDPLTWPVELEADGPRLLSEKEIVKLAPLFREMLAIEDALADGEEDDED